MMSPRTVFLGSFTALFLATAAVAEDLAVIPKLPGSVAPDAMMAAYLKQLAFAALDRRDAEYGTLQTPDELAAWQRGRREAFLAALGEFPALAPLNARTTGDLKFADYRVEKVIFESQPGFFVTAALYLPLTPGPHPAVVHPTGHTDIAKAGELYQRASILLAKNGLACLCYDPVGQGERRHFFNPDGTPEFSTTQEHMLMGAGSTLLGISIARTMIWDGMRAVDYLQSRADIDPARIGCTGISGGGTMTSYLGALDERIAASAPGCYLTGFRRLLETIGPQDAEQNLFGQIANGLDHGDYVLLRAPRPTLIMAATQDYFDITGAWNLFRQAKRFYTRLGFAERVEIIEPDTKHGFPTEMRVGATRWMRRWFFGSNDAISEDDFPVLPAADLQCTPDGQVLRLPDARSLFDLNRDWEQRLAAGRKQLWQDKPAALREVRRITGIRPLADIPPLKAENVGALERDGYRIEKLLLHVEPGISLPALMFSPPESRGAAHLYLHGEGKHVDAMPGGPIEELVRAGHPVLAVDLRGLGEMHQGKSNATAFDPFVGSDWRETTLAYLLGKSFVAMRAEDVLASARFLASRSTDAPPGITVVAIGETGVPALHAAALEPQLFGPVKISRSLASWADVVQTPLSRNQQVNAVFGALRAYDLPDLAASLVGENITITEPLDAAGNPINAAP
jgi:dienelactone hydrolase